MIYSKNWGRQKAKNNSENGPQNFLVVCEYQNQEQKVIYETQIVTLKS